MRKTRPARKLTVEAALARKLCCAQFSRKNEGEETVKDRSTENEVQEARKEDRKDVGELRGCDGREGSGNKTWPARLTVDAALEREIYRRD